MFEKAQWIGLNKTEPNEAPYAKRTRLAARYLRKGFVLTSIPKKAIVYFCGLGLSELYVNGKKISDDLLSPPLSTYNKTAYYVTYDITSFLQSGRNVIGVILGNGRFLPPFIGDHCEMPHYGLPKLILQANIIISDNTEHQVLSNESWKITANGPIRDNNEYHGERYDARMELPDWDKAEFDDSAWEVVDICDSPSEQLLPTPVLPIRVMETISPKKINQLGNGKYVIDFGQNISGWIRIKTKGKKGHKITLRFAEILKSDGNIDRTNLSEAESTDEYILKGAQEEIWEPRFTIHGFRYAEISGFENEISGHNIQAKLIHNKMDTSGFFKCSNEILNQIYRACFYGIADNYRSIPLDEPVRSERLGYLGDRSIVAKSESFIFNNQLFYEKWLDDIADSQRDNGSIPQNAPAYWEYYVDDVTWPSAYFTIADMLYEQYGNSSVIEKHFPNMSKWWYYMFENYQDNGLVKRDFLGDWVVPPSETELIHTKDQFRITDGEFLGASFFYYITRLMEKFAGILKLDKDAVFFTLKANIQHEKFHESFFDTKTNAYKCNTPTANILALAFGLVPDSLINTIVSNLKERIAVIFSNHLPVGMIGLKFLMRTLTNYEMEELAWKIATQTSYPGWGYMIKNGATTIWELWNGNTAKGEMISFNNPMNIGDLIIWLYENLAGIKNASDSIAYRSLEMKLTIPDGLDFVDAEYESPNGLIKSRWEKSHGGLKWDVTIPENSKARLYISAKTKSKVTINGQLPGDKSHFEDGFLVCQVSSGNYQIYAKDYKPVYCSKNERLPMPDFSSYGESNDKPIVVEIKSTEINSEIRYTTDGSEPDVHSELYTESLLINGYTFIRAACFKPGKTQSYARQAIFDVFNKQKNGLSYKYYEGDNWEVIPDFDNLIPKKTGTTHDLDISKINQRNDFWGIRFIGYIHIKIPGEYKLFIATDDGSRLFINNKMTIDHDGIHPVTQKSAKIKLPAGKHAIQIDYFQAVLGYDFTFMIQGPGIPKQPVPVSMLELL